MVLKNTNSSSAIRVVVGCKSNKRRTTAGTRDELPVVIRFWMQAAHHHHKFQIVVVVVDGSTQEKSHLSSAGLAVPLAQNFRFSKATHGIQIQQTPASYFLQQS
jgi:hypothetical protein